VQSASAAGLTQDPGGLAGSRCWSALVHDGSNLVSQVSCDSTSSMRLLSCWLKITPYSALTCASKLASSRYCSKTKNLRGLSRSRYTVNSVLPGSRRTSSAKPEMSLPTSDSDPGLAVNSAYKIMGTST